MITQRHLDELRSSKDALENAERQLAQCARAIQEAHNQKAAARERFDAALQAVSEAA